MILSSDDIAGIKGPRKFRKKPVEIEAYQLTSDMLHGHEPIPWVFPKINYHGDDATDRVFTPYLIIETLEGDHQAHAGDWIIKGVKGEFYPCRDDIFRLTYSPSETTDPDLIETIEAQAKRIGELETALRWALPLAELALDSHRYDRIKNGHNHDIQGTHKDGTQRLGLWQKEVDEIDFARSALQSPPSDKGES